MPSAVNQTLIGVGFLYWGHVLTVEIFGYGDFLRFFIGVFRNGYRHFCETCYLGGSVSALPKYDFVAVGVCEGAYLYRLKHSLLTDTLCEFCEAFLGIVLARVVCTWLNVCQCNHCEVHCAC